MVKSSNFDSTLLIFSQGKIRNYIKSIFRKLNLNILLKIVGFERHADYIRGSVLKNNFKKLEASCCLF